MLVYQQDHVSMHCKDVIEPVLANLRLVFVTKTGRRSRQEGLPDRLTDELHNIEFV